MLYPLSYGRVIVDNRQSNMGLRGAVRSPSAVRMFASREEEGSSWVGGRLPSNTKVNNFGEGTAVLDPVAGVSPRPVGVEAAT